MVFDKEYYEIINIFEKTYKNLRLDKEDKEYWLKSIVYQDGEVNKLFLSYLSGYNFGKINA
jgi:hypothetical protein